MPEAAPLPDQTIARNTVESPHRTAVVRFTLAHLFVCEITGRTPSAPNCGPPS
jgi:hypothetical protein